MDGTGDMEGMGDREGMGDAGGRGKLVVMEDVKGGGARDSGWSASKVTYERREGSVTTGASRIALDTWHGKLLSQIMALY